METSKEVMALFSDEKIVVTDHQIATKNNTDLSFTNIKKVIYIIEGAEKDNLEEPLAVLLQKMNAAIKYNDEDKQILFYPKNTIISLELLKQVYHCELVVIFGSLWNLEHSQFQFIDNKLLKINGIQVIQTDTLSIIHENATAKTAFWNAIKVIIQ
jgi:hypothetical protein